MVNFAHFFSVWILMRLVFTAWRQQAVVWIDNVFWKNSVFGVMALLLVTSRQNYYCVGWLLTYYDTTLMVAVCRS